MSALLIRIAIRYPGTQGFLNQFQIGLKEVDLILWVQSDNCLLPVLRASKPELVSTRLTLADLRRNSSYSDLK